MFFALFGFYTTNGKDTGEEEKAPPRCGLNPLGAKKGPRVMPQGQNLMACKRYLWQGEKG